MESQYEPGLQLVRSTIAHIVHVLAAGILLHSDSRAVIGVAKYPVNDLKLLQRGVLVQAHLRVDGAVTGRTKGTPLNIEDTIGGSARNRGENASARAARVEVIPQSSDGIIEPGIWEAVVYTSWVVAEELQVTVGTDVHRGERLVVQLDWKR